MNLGELHKTFEQTVGKKLRSTSLLFKDSTGVEKWKSVVDFGEHPARIDEGSGEVIRISRLSSEAYEFYIKDDKIHKFSKISIDNRPYMR